ncbi:MAG: hypothetical protein ABIK79_13460 [Chloroflexota bacterium]
MGRWMMEKGKGMVENGCQWYDFHFVIRVRGDKGTRGQGDKETRRPGDREIVIC